MSILKRSFLNLMNNQMNNQIRSISASQLMRSDALYVHREKDADIKNFQFNNENQKVF